MTFVWVLASVLVSATLSVAQDGSKYFITAPNIFRVGVEQTVSVTVFNADQVNVELYLQDYPDRKKTFSQTEGVFSNDVPGTLTVQINPEDLPEKDPHEPVTKKQYVYMVAKSAALGFQEESVVLVSHRSGFVFIQTDKPIYNPEQEVKIRILPLDHRMKPSDTLLRMEILNPQGVIVERRDDITSDTGIKVELFRFPLFPMFGFWSVVVSYGPEHMLNSSVQFEVKEYVLPTYSLEIKPQKHILPQSRSVIGTVEANYVYGKPVSGNLYMKFGVDQGDGKMEIIRTLQSWINEGTAFFELPVEAFVTSLGENWFEDSEGKRLFIEASVTEDGTGLIENMTDNTAVFARSPYKFTFDQTVKYFKPGLPYELKLVVTHVNNQPAHDIPIEIRAQAVSDGGVNIDLLNEGDPARHAISNEYGEVYYRIDVPRDAKTVRITARTNKGDILPEQNKEELFTAQPYESSSGGYLLVRAQGAPFFVRSNINAEALVTQELEISKINYYVVARGKIIHHATVVREVGVITTLTFEVTPEMSPSSRLIVYYITDAGDVVCDAIWLDIKDECENRLSVRANRAEYEPDSDAVITVTGDPGTFVGVLAVDKAVYLLNDEHKLTAQKMFQRMDKFDLGCGPGGGRNAKEVFEDVGLLVITNAGLETEKRESYGCNAVAAARKKRSLLSDAEEYTGVLRDYCEEGQIRTRTAPLSGIDVDIYCEEQAVEGIFEKVLPLQDPRVIAFIDCCVNALLIATDNRGRLGVFEDGWTDAENIIEDESELQVRSDFPETWIFADEFLDDNGQMILPVTVPSSLTQWIVQAVGVSRDTGMCVAEPFELLAFKEFFIQLSLPYSVIKGEQIEIRAAVFNYGEHDLIVRAYLYGVDDICSEAKPGERSERKEFIVKAKEATSITFPVIPMSVGEFPIRISAFSPAGGDIVEKILKVEPAGVERSFVHSVFLDPSGLMRNEVQEVNNGENNHNHHDFASNDYVDIQNQNQHNVLDLRMPPDVVPGSAECRVNIVGNLMGPTVSAVIGDNLQGLLRQPTGCGEQTLIYTAPSIYVLLYLTATDKVTPDIEKKAHDYIRAGYARELTYYKNNPGCFSVWTHKPCSTWLTAFAMKIFCQASEFVVVDPKVICGATNWLLTMQNDDGSIRENFLVYHKEMTGGVHADATFTAYVLISLLECDCNTAEMSTAILNSVLYLERAIDVADRPYAVAIITYALALANSEKKHEANEKLRAMSTYDEATNSRHWTTDAASFGDGNKPYWYTRNPSAIGVETTGYALLAQVELGDITYSNAIVVWLTSQRNAQGGFVSTQDTVIALQALASYASEAGRSSDLDMECEVTSEADPGYREVILLNDEGATMQHIREAPTDGKLYVDTTGSGIGNLQVEVRYNSQATYAETCSFNITVIAAEPRLGRIDEVPVEHENERIDLDVIDRSRVGRDVDRVQRAAARQDNSDYIIHMTVSVRFNKPGGTGMAIVDVGLFSGFEPIKKGLEKLTNDVVSPVQRYEVNKRSIIFYVDEITDQNNVVIEFDIKRVYNVGQIQPVAIKVYDYYSPDTQCTKFYHAGEGSALLNTLCVGDLCVCAEGKCAKCLDEPGVKLEKKNELVIKACRDMDYAFKVLVVDVKSENGFDLITAVIEVLAKRGLDEVLPHEQRRFWKSSNCACPKMRPEGQYLVMGKDGLPFVDENGNESYKYIIDERSYVETFPTEEQMQRNKFRNRNRTLLSTIRTLNTIGCPS